MWRISTYLVLECDAVLLCSDFNTSQSFLERESRHLLQRWKTKDQKANVKDPTLTAVVVSQDPSMLLLVLIPTAASVRTLTFAFSEILLPDGDPIAKETTTGNVRDFIDVLDNS